MNRSWSNFDPSNFCLAIANLQLALLAPLRSGEIRNDEGDIIGSVINRRVRIY